MHCFARWNMLLYVAQIFLVFGQIKPFIEPPILITTTKF